MSTFFTSLLYAAVAGGVSAAVAGKAFEKHIRYLTALLCTALVVSPVLSFVLNADFNAPDAGGGVSADSNGAIEMICKQAAEDMEKNVADYIFAQEGIKPLEVSIQIESKDSTLEVSSLRIRLERAEEVSAVKELLGRLFGNAVPTEVLADG